MPDVPWLATSDKIVCVETTRWSWSDFHSSMLSALPFLAVPALLHGLLAGLLFGLSVGLFIGLVVGLIVGLFIWLVVGLLFGLLGGLTFSNISTSVNPNEGIHRSARNALSFGSYFGLVVGPLVVLVVWPVFGLHMGLLVGILIVPVAVLGGGLRAGGAACIKHLVLRLGLIRNGSTPWNYVKFLDYTADRILLRKVGGGYMFIHRLLLEYFAARYIEDSVAGTRRLKPRAIDVES